MLHDLRYTVRALAKRPSFALGSILVLALAVGVNTAVFSLVNALLLRPLPVPAADGLVFVYPSDDRSVITYASYRELRQKADVFSAMAARSTDQGRLRTGADVVPIQGEVVTAGYFELLGLTPKIGRTFATDEDRAAGDPVAVISEGLWKSQFAADPAILGRTLRIDAAAAYSGRYAAWRDYTIVGVMPASFTGTGNPWQPAQYWLLIEQRLDDYRAARGPLPGPLDGIAMPIGRLKPGVTIEQARAPVEAIASDIFSRLTYRPKTGATFVLRGARRVRLPFQGAYFMDVPRILATLSAVGTILLIIAGTNLAGMLLARGVSRRSEIAIRLSLGIARPRLVRQLLIESLLLAIAAGAIGVLVAQGLVGGALHGLPSELPGSSGSALVIDVPLDARVLAFAFASGIVTAICVGLAPAVQAMRIDLLAALAGAASPTAGRSHPRMRRFVLVPQIALSLVLLLVSGVFVRTLLRLELAHPGYDASHVVAVDVQLPQQTTEPSKHLSEEKARTREMQSRVLDRLAALPGVTGAAVVDYTFDGVPLANSSVSIISRTAYETTREYHGAYSTNVSADYFRTLDIPLLRGRYFDARDRAETASTVIVSKRLADQLWPGVDPIGQQLAMHEPKSLYPIRWLDVVGEVASVTRPQDEYARPAFYRPIEGSPLVGTTFLVRGAGNPAALAAAAKQAVMAADSSLIVARARSLEDTISDVRYPRRFSAAILGASGTAALLLAAIGVFALMSYAVAQRIGEIGVRMVLGARRRDIVRLIVKDGATLAIAGIALGFAFAFAAIRYASHAIVPLPDIDAVTFVTVPVILAAVVLLACYLPARRAARVDPLVVLRNA